MNIKVGNYDVLESGCVISLENEPVVFFIDDLEIRLLFQSSESGEMNVKFEKESNKKATLFLENFNDSIGCGNTKPYVLGTYKSRELALLFRFSMLKTGGRSIQYTWLLGGPKHVEGK